MSDVYASFLYSLCRIHPRLREVLRMFDVCSLFSITHRNARIATQEWLVCAEALAAFYTTAGSKGSKMRADGIASECRRLCGVYRRTAPLDKILVFARNAVVCLLSTDVESPAYAAIETETDLMLPLVCTLTSDAINFLVGGMKLMETVASPMDRQIWNEMVSSRAEMRDASFIANRSCEVVDRDMRILSAIRSVSWGGDVRARSIISDEWDRLCKLRTESHRVYFTKPPPAMFETARRIGCGVGKVLMASSMMVGSVASG